MRVTIDEARAVVDGVLKRSFYFRNDKFYSPDRLDQAFDEVWTAVNFAVGHSGLSVTLIQDTISVAVDRKLATVHQAPTRVTLGDVAGLSDRLASIERSIGSPAVQPASVAVAGFDDSKLSARIDVIERRLTELHNAFSTHVSNKSMHAVITSEIEAISNGLLSVDERLKAAEAVLERLKEMVS